MAEPNFDIQIDDSRLQRALETLDRNLRNLKPAFEEIGEVLLTSVVKNFEAGGRYRKAGDWRGGSRTWQPLSVATLFKGKKSRFATKSGKFSKKGIDFLKNRKILFQKGNLLNSINWRASNDSVQVGTNRVYAAIHQFGGKAGRGRKVTIPARPYLVVQDEDLDQALDVLDDFLLGKI